VTVDDAFRAFEEIAKMEPKSHYYMQISVKEWFEAQKTGSSVMPIPTPQELGKAQIFGSELRLIGMIINNWRDQYDKKASRRKPGSHSKKQANDAARSFQGIGSVLRGICASLPDIVTFDSIRRGLFAIAEALSWFTATISGGQQTRQTFEKDIRTALDDIMATMGDLEAITAVNGAVSWQRDGPPISLYDRLEVGYGQLAPVERWYRPSPVGSDFQDNDDVQHGDDQEIHGMTGDVIVIVVDDAEVMEAEGGELRRGEGVNRVRDW
jgi:hypothetical protein